jgi:hypothetical protein
MRKKKLLTFPPYERRSLPIPFPDEPAEAKLLFVLPLTQCELFLLSDDVDDEVGCDERWKLPTRWTALQQRLHALTREPVPNHPWRRVLDRPNADHPQADHKEGRRGTPAEARVASLIQTIAETLPYLREHQIEAMKDHVDALLAKQRGQLETE